jgi:hypothetical protein
VAGYSLFYSLLGLGALFTPPVDAVAPHGEFLVVVARPYARDFQRHPVKGPLRGHIERLAVFSSLGEVVWMFWTDHRPQMLAQGRNDSQSDGPETWRFPSRSIFDFVDAVFAERVRHIDEDFLIS